ncbi:SprT family zinc-dependent metalloprotease [Aurantivibrio plasticivorans]
MSAMTIGKMALSLNRKLIKNLHISVLPPDGKVRVSAPNHLSDAAIRMAVVSKIPWIKKQQAEFASQARESAREMVTGETHYVWGKRLRLEVVTVSGKQQLKKQGASKLKLAVNPDATVSKKQALLTEWYRDQLKEAIPRLLVKWERKLGVKASSWGVKKMKTKWGSCNTQRQSIWLNLDLAKKPPECLEFILVHELVHLLERSHNERFKSYMDKFLPDWRERRALLNRMPLAHENWQY